MNHGDIIWRYNFMIRTVISLNDDDKLWLDKMAKLEHLPMTEIVRRAIHCYRNSVKKQNKLPVEDLLNLTRGIWENEEGLTYQNQLRDEWKK